MFEAINTASGATQNLELSEKPDREGEGESGLETHCRGFGYASPWPAATSASSSHVRSRSNQPLPGTCTTPL